MKSNPMRRVLLFISILSFACSKGEPANSAAAFERVSTERTGVLHPTISGDARRWYIPESNGNGAAWIDYDSDGDFDLFVGNGCEVNYADGGKRFEILRKTTSHLYKNNLNFRFADVTEEAGVACREWVNGVATGDIDGDGAPDLYLANFGADVLYKNIGGPDKLKHGFADATQAAGIVNLKWSASAAFGDADNDGDLDLYVANYVEFDPERPPADGRRNIINGVEVAWGPEKENPGMNIGAPDVYFKNSGNGIFTNSTRESGFELKAPLCSYAVIFSDVNRDGWQEVLVANDGQPCNLFMNQKNGTFREEGEARGFALSADGKATAAMGLCAEDYDFDGDMDIFRTNFDMEANSLHVNDGNGYFTDRAAEAGLAAPSVDRLGWACGFVDFENDGDLDLIVSNGHVYPQAELIGMHPFLQTQQFYEASESAPGKIVYKDITPSIDSSVSGKAAGRSFAFCDLDLDGALDFVMIQIDEPPKIIRNKTAARGAWLSVVLRGSKSNRDGIGARVSVTSGSRTWTREMRTASGLYSSHAPQLHFGLGATKQIDRIRVQWPSGAVQTIEGAPVDQFLMIREAGAPAAK
ncbi:MAG: CRTAC1 family protein [Planctomycetota bacterium]